MLDTLIAAWLATATVRTMPDTLADGAPLVLVVNTDVPPRDAWHDIARRAACRSFPGADVLTYLLVQMHDADDDSFVPAAFHRETVKCDGLSARDSSAQGGN
jgi:hypothetical protein